MVTLNIIYFVQISASFPQLNLFSLWKMETYKAQTGERNNNYNLRVADDWKSKDSK